MKSYIQRHVKGVPPKYTYSEESRVNPAFQRIEEVDAFLKLNEKRIFALRSDFILATGVKNAEQQHGYHGLIVFYDTTPEQDDIDSALFFKNKPFAKNESKEIKSYILLLIIRLSQRYDDF